MKVRVTKFFKAVPTGAVYGVPFSVGQVVDGEIAALAFREGWGEQVADGSTGADANQQTLAANTNSPPAKRDPLDHDGDGKKGGSAPAVVQVPRAKMTKAYPYTDETGKTAPLPKGLVVEGDVALEMVKLGVAQPLAPVDKAVTAAPETK